MPLELYCTTSSISTSSTRQDPCTHTEPSSAFLSPTARGNKYEAPIQFQQFSRQSGRGDHDVFSVHGVTDKDESAEDALVLCASLQL